MASFRTNSPPEFYIVERIVPFSTRVSVHKLAAYADAGFLFKPGYMERGLKFRIWNVREYHLVRIGQRVKCPQIFIGAAVPICHHDKEPVPQNSLAAPLPCSLRFCRGSIMFKPDVQIAELCSRVRHVFFRLKHKRKTQIFPRRSEKQNRPAHARQSPA